MVDEQEFLNEGGTYVSSTTINIGGTTYATANITSVSKQHTHPSTGCAIAIIIVGGLIGLISLLIAIGGPSAGGFISFILFGGLAGLGVLWLRSLTSDYHVVLRSSSGESRGLTSKNEAEVDRVTAAITEAITHRG